MDMAVVTLSLAALALGLVARLRLPARWATFCSHLRRAHRPIRLLPGERPLALILPDRELCLLRLGLTVVVLAAALRLVAPGGDVDGVPPLALFAAFVAVPVLVEGLRAARGGWLVTDRRLIARSGASIPLAALRRIAVGPTALVIEAGDARRFALSGLVNPRAAARLILDVARGRERE